MRQSNGSDEATDDALLRCAADGDREAFRLLVRRHQGMVTRFACYLLHGDRTAAEDIGQEAFLRLYRTAREYTARGAMRGFLLTITRNLCRDYLRRQHPTASLEAVVDRADPAPTGEISALQDEGAE